MIKFLKNLQYHGFTCLWGLVTRIKLCTCVCSSQAAALKGITDPLLRMRSIDNVG